MASYAPLSAYYSIAQQYKEISIEEKIKLILRAKKGDKEAQQKFLYSFVPMILKRVYGLTLAHNIDYEDLVQDCFLALIDLIKRYTPERSSKVNSIAYGYINSAIMRSLSNNNESNYSLIRIPKFASKYYHRYESGNHTHCSVAELRKKLGCSRLAVFNVFNVKAIYETTNLTKAVEYICQVDKNHRIEDCSKPPLILLYDYIDEKLEGQDLQLATWYFKEHRNFAEISRIMGEEYNEVVSRINAITSKLKSFVQVKKHCKECNKEFVVRHPNQTFCCKYCFRKHHHRGSLLKKPTIKTCKECGCSFEILFRCENKRKYCCRDCYYASRNRNKIQKRTGKVDSRQT